MFNIILLLLIIGIIIWGGVTNWKFISKNKDNYEKNSSHNFENIKILFDQNKDLYSSENHMGKTINHMMSLNEQKVVLTYLQYVLNKDIEGDIVELGCHQGSTTIILQKLLDLNNSNKKLYVYDSFEGFPETNNKEDNNQGKRGDLAVSKDNFIKNLKKYNIKLPIINKGFFADINDDKYPSKICFAFYDGDLYQSTIDALNKIYKKMQKGGVIVFDDFQHPTDMFPGVKKACLKFFKDDRVKFVGDSHILNIKDDFFHIPSKTISQGVLLI